ncbi:signal recognition particle receptor FtsY [Natrialba magadii ATCC 43099]|uniref:Signal recognition particle receptor FtsY n=1 Tax=Natrialba magadii (strain ATCC 43099 / DSM 3394 / CCM 3739 / CIP 104546 / IAM 13178 / JCM 8861 / NBRC 102185 / NCIMB 2190 / MS3) TaxID=547559 RepID=D3SUY1_NATMM|nr:signal recognition particle-docking protein FtsY [Natrialba magadii]ADD05389.1 signal recognition particle receptor FtsY [Natrialba magadii ATCC 43099]ELY29296.1 cell division protein FtsY [Natrialba magadii ATCC 43099]
MFDNLKKKLGSFRKDAEEAAEENVEEVDDPAADVDGVESDVEEADIAETADSEPAADAGADVETDVDVDVDVDVDADADAHTTESTDPTDQAVAEPSASTESESTTTTTTTSKTAPSDTALESPAETSAETEAETETEPESDLETAGEVDADPDVADGSETDDAEDAEDTTNNGSTGFGRKAKSFVKGKFVIEEEDLEGPLHELEMALLSSDVEMGVAEEILDNIRDELIGETRTFTTSTGEVVEEALRDAIYDVISVGQFDFDERIAIEDKPVTIIFTGVNGVGKTTSIAKLSRYFEERGYSTVMANGDTYRAGANEQIQEHANALDTKLITHEQGGDPAAVLYDAVEYAEANDVDVVLGDTAGRLHTDEGLMDQLEKIDRVVDPDMTLFVDEAVAGQDAVNRAREFNNAAEIDGAILTKADADSNGGAAISVAHVTGRPILFLGVGQGYDHIERFDPEEMVDRLLEEE